MIILFISLKNKLKMKTLKQKIQIKRNNNKFNRQKTKAKNK